MKNVFKLLGISVVLLSLVACGAKEEAKQEVKPVVVQEAVQPVEEALQTEADNKAVETSNNLSQEEKKIAYMQTWLGDQKLSTETKAKIENLLAELNAAAKDGNKEAAYQLNYWTLAKNRSDEYQAIGAKMKDPNKFYLKRFPELSKEISFE